MKQAITVPQLTLPFRDEKVVDTVVGKKRKSVKDCEPVDFSECPLAQAYPNYDSFLEELYIERRRQRDGYGPAHPRAIKPAHGQLKVQKYDRPAWEDGPSVADVNKAYKTTDRGR